MSSIRYLYLIAANIFSMRAWLVIFLFVSGFALDSCIANAASLDEVLTHFTADEFGDTNEGIVELAASGNARAEVILRALRDGRMRFSAGRKAVFIEDDAGKLFNAATGQSITGAPPIDLAEVRVNNRLRGIVDEALDKLTLLSSDPKTRFAAAEAAFKSQDVRALTTLERAIAQETDSRVKRAQQEARAAIILSLDNITDSEKLLAIAVLRERGDQAALAILEDVKRREARAPVEVLRQRVFELIHEEKYSEAIPLAQQALAIDEKALGPDHRDVASALNNLAVASITSRAATPRPSRSTSGRWRSTRRRSGPIIPMSRRC